MIRTFESGAVRSSAEGKPEYAGYFHPVVIQEFAEYMLKHQQLPDGSKRDCRNWQKGIDLESYMQSMWRHFHEVWFNYEAHRLSGRERDVDVEIIESLMALMFNVQGMAFEIIKGEQ